MERGLELEEDSSARGGAVRCWKCGAKVELSSHETLATCPACESRVAVHRLNIPAIPVENREQGSSSGRGVTLEQLEAPIAPPGPAQSPGSAPPVELAEEPSLFLEIGRAGSKKREEPAEEEDEVAKAEVRPQRHFQSLQAYRGLAALGVLVFHLPLVAQEEMGASYSGFDFRVGEVGVDFFFVLSGFIIATVHRNDIGIGSAAPKYLLKRLFRIYPLVIFACLIKLTYLLTMGGGAMADKANPYLVLSSFALFPLPNNSDYLIGVMWTLSHEMLFYLLFLVPILFGLRVSVIVASLWVALIVGINVTQTTFPAEGLVMSFLARPCNLEFLLGCAVAFLPSLVTRSRLAWGVMAAAVAWLAMAFFVSERYVTSDFNVGVLDLGYRLAWGPAFALLIYATIALEGRHRFRVPSILLLLGNASFSIYLFHTSALHILMKFATKPSSPLQSVPLWVTYGSVAILTVLVGVGVYYFVEKRMLNWSRSMIPKLLPAKG